MAVFMDRIASESSQCDVMSTFRVLTFDELVGCCNLTVSCGKNNNKNK